MKIRQGFVSNSSSSSFIIAFPRKPESAEEVRKLLFGDKTHINAMYGEDVFTTVSAAESVFGCLEQASREDVECEVESGTVYDGEFSHDEMGPEYPTFDINMSRAKTDELWASYRIERKKFAGAVSSEFFSANPNAFFCIVEYGDHDNFGSTMEHGDVFRNIPHIRVNKH